jgi:hypothetical protein
VDQVCAKGACHFKSCADEACVAGSACDQGKCVEVSCLGIDCSGGGTCSNGVCRAASCDAVLCPSGTACAQGVCVACPEGDCNASMDAGDDSGTRDAGVNDAGTHDAGTKDAGTHDAGQLDVTDAGADAGCLDPSCPCTGGATRGCYPFGAGLSDPTVNRGVCRAGTQTCTSASTWGACVGAIIPSAQSCSGSDENCDGRIDEGCPTGLSVSAGASSGVFGRSDGGSPFDGPCPAGQVARGISVVTWPMFTVYSVSIFCGALSVMGNTSVTPTVYTVNLVAGGSAGPFGYPSFPQCTTQTYNCPAGSMLWGLSGQDSASGIASLTLRCGALTINGQHGSFTLNRVPVATSPVLGTTAPGSPFMFDCPANQVITGVYGHSGSWVDKMGVRCGVPELELKP